MLCDDPNESSAVYLLTSDDKHANANQLLCQNISDDSSLKRLSIMCQARKKFDRCPFRNINVKQLCADYVK